MKWARSGADNKEVMYNDDNNNNNNKDSYTWNITHNTERTAA